MWLMLQQEKPDDYVIATGHATTVRDMCAIAFRHVGLSMDDHRVIDLALIRPTKIEVMLDNPAEATFGWEAESSLEALTTERVDADMKHLSANA